MPGRHSSRSVTMQGQNFSLRWSVSQRLGPDSNRLTDAKWCQPKLTVRVKHLAGSKTLRHATLKGFLHTEC
jgi:hypothetical protein